MGAIAEHIRKKLEQDLRTKGLQVWLDKENEFTDLVDEWIEQKKDGLFAYDIIAFRGSFLELMVQSRKFLSGKDNPKCVIHMPGFNEQEIKATPVLEAYRAGQRFRVSLETMVRETAQGRLTEDQTKYLLNTPSLTLATAEAYMSNEQDVPPEIQRLLNKYGEDGLVLKFLEYPAAINDELCVETSQRFLLLKEYFKKLLGLDEQWQVEWNHHQESYEHPDNQADLLMSYLMAMEYVNDLRVTPPSIRLQALKDKQKEFHRKADSILEQIREKNPALYIKWAAQIETNLWPKEIIQDPKDLGRVDTFRFEADAFVTEAMRLLEESQWQQAHELAQTRMPGRKNETLAHTFWLQQDRQRLWLWEWIETAASLGKEVAIVNSSLKPLQPGKLSHDDLSKLYVNKWWELDKIHRDFSLFSERHQSTQSGNNFKTFVAIRKNLRSLYRECIDEQSKVWNALCEAIGFLPPASLQQRNFFSNWVQPALEKKKKTALFFVDALRYELGMILKEKLENISKQPQIEYMLAELPTITAVGMNALIPVVENSCMVPLYDSANGTITGFKGGERQVRNAEDRHKTLQEHAGIETAWLTMNELLEQSDRVLSKSTDKQLLVITALDIDKMGESGASSFGIDYIEKVIGRIRTSIQKLKEKGYEEFIITADHGFIIGDESLEDGRASKLQNAERRFAIDTQRGGENLVSVSFPQLNYTIPQPSEFFVFERSSHLLVRQSGTNFYHGGNTLQERLLPVIILSSTKQATGGSHGSFELHIQTMSGVLGYHRITVLPKAVNAMQLFVVPNVEVRLTSDQGIEVEIGEVVGAEVTGDLLRLPVDKPTEVYFKLLKGTSSKAQIRFESTQAGTKISCVEGNTFYEVQKVETETVSSDGKHKKEKPITSKNFSDEIPEDYHTALAHLQKHKVLTEKFLANSFGGGREGARKARAFANKISDWVKFLPFNVCSEQTSEGKEYRVK